MNTEQERADFEAWHKRTYGRQPVLSCRGYYQATLHNERWMIWKAIAALQSQPNHDAWKEAAIAWGVCASLNRKFCKGRDPLFKARQADFVKHAEAARTRALETDVLQSQDREDAERYRYLITKLQQVYDGDYFEIDPMSLYCHMQSQFKGDRVIGAEITWGSETGESIGLSEAIDQARRIEGEVK